ncbi:hypothetical protein VN12_20760 [Pirellula sp. SH-Sr6A]|nr:hypothetical protein VN12_20760 [Pirellula sp. SH-Sr6A]
MTTAMTTSLLWINYGKLDYKNTKPSCFLGVTFP